MTIALVDDAVLGAVLRGSTPPRLRRRQLATTGLWYVRLCQAALRSSAHGALSRPFTGLPAELHQRALAAVIRLPDEITVLSLRDLGARMGQLRNEHPLNALSLEALAAAEELAADVYLSTPSPRLEGALAATGRRSVHLPAMTGR